MRRSWLWLVAVGLFLLLAPEARAQTKDAFYDATLGNAKSTVGEGLHIDVRGKVVDLYITGVDGTADATIYVKCSETDSSEEDDWGICSPSYEVIGQAKLALSLARAQWVKVYISTIDAGSVTGRFVLETTR